MIVVCGFLLVVIALLYQLFSKPRVNGYNVDQLVKLLHEFEKNISQNQTWTLVSVHQGVRTWSHQTSGAFKCEVVVPAPIEIINRVLEVPGLEREWNPSMEKAQAIHQVKDGAHQVYVVRMILRGFARLRRVYTVARIFELTNDGDECFVFMKSVQWPADIEPKFPLFRGIVQQGGFRIRKIDHASSHVTFALEQSLGAGLFLFQNIETIYSKQVAYQTALGLKEFFSHQTISEISHKIYDLTKNDASPQVREKRRSSVAAGAVLPPVDRTQRLVAQGKKLIENLLAAVEDDGTWTVIPDNLGIQIRTRRTEGTAIAGVMGKGRVEAPPRAILDCLLNIKDKKQYDTMFAEGKVVEVINEQTCFIYQAYEAVWPTSARDFCSLQYWTKMPDESIVLASAECPHDQCPERQGMVRATIVLAGLILKPINGTTACDVTYYAMSDLKGNVPASVVNIAIQKNPLVIDGIRKYVSKMDLSKYTALDVGGSASTTRTAAVTAATAESNPPAPDLQKEPVPKDVLSSLDAAYEMLITNSSTETERSGAATDWVFVETRKDITITKKVDESSPVHSFKGEGTIQRPMEEILESLLDVPFRLKYDTMCKKIRKVKEYSEGVQLIHSSHSTKQCLLTTEREFLFATQYRVDRASDRHFVVAKSVERDDLVPQTPDVVRAEIVGAGWILIPKGKYTIVTYIVQVDVKGKIPVAVVNAVSVKQPLCIHYLRQAMEEEKAGSVRKGSTASTWSN